MKTTDYKDFYAKGKIKLNDFSTEYQGEMEKSDGEKFLQEEKEKLTKEKNALSIHHKGFYKGLLLYDTKHNRWTNIGDYPFPAQVTTTAVMWGNDILISNGEIKPGIRTPNVMLGKIK